MIALRRRHHGASDGLLRKARNVILEDDLLELADPTIRYARPGFDDLPVQVAIPASVDREIRDALKSMGASYSDSVVAMWAHLYVGGPSPVGPLATVQAEQTWRTWFEAEGIAPSAIGAVRYEHAPSPYSERPAEGPRTPQEAQRETDRMERASGDTQAQQQASVDAWRSRQLLELQQLWHEGYQEGVRNFAQQYPELATDDFLAELEAEDWDTDNSDSMGPHQASIGKMVGELNNLLMLAPAPAAIADWFDTNVNRVQMQAETLAWQAEQHGYQEAGSNFGLQIEWQSEGDDRVCDDCAGLEANGPYTDEAGDNPLPAAPGDGSTQCGPNCRCTLNYLEPDQPSLAEDLFGAGQNAGSDQVLDSGAVANALGVQALADLEGVSLLDTYDEYAIRARHLDAEVGIAFDAKGRILDSAMGDATSVAFTEEQLQKQYGADLVVHNHPSSGSFSPSDVAFAYSQGVGEMRVVSPTWDYSLKPLGTKKFAPEDAAAVINAAQQHVEDLYPQVKARAEKRYHAQFGKEGAHLSYAEIFQQESTNFWHNVWSRTAAEHHFAYERTPAKHLDQMVHVQPATVTDAQIHASNLKAVGQLPLSFPTSEKDLLVLSPTTGPSGSQAGFWLEDKAQGVRYYVKPMDSEHAANEVGAMRAYELAGAKPGVDIPWTSVIYRQDDKPVVVSRFVANATSKSGSWWASPQADFARVDAHKFWAMDALLSHHDVVGLVNDNLLVRGTGVFRVETGGAMAFRATGAAKLGWKVGEPWTEPWTLRGIAHDGIPGGLSVEPVFGQMSNADAAKALSTLKKLDLATLDKAWSDLGMTVTQRFANMDVIKWRLGQLDQVTEKLGMVKGAGEGAAIAAKVGPYKPSPPPALASQIKYKPWNPSSDAYGKKLAVTFKPWFEEFKKFSPITGVASNIVAQLSAGAVFPAFAIKQGPAKIARLQLRVAFARSYNAALHADSLAALPPTVKAFWTEKLGLVDAKSSVSVQHVIDNWIGKGAPPAVEKIATHLPLWDFSTDPTGSGFLAAHPSFGHMAVPDKVWPDAKLLGKGNDIYGWALGYNAQLTNPEGFATEYPALAAYWQKALGDLPAQPEHLSPIPAVSKQAAVESATAHPYKDMLENAKDEISKGQDPNVVMAGIQEQFVDFKLDPNEMIDGLVKFGIAGNEESAANIVADWVDHAQQLASEAETEKFSTFGPPSGPPPTSWLLDYDKTIANLLPSGTGTPQDVTIAKKWAQFKNGELPEGGTWYEAMKSWSEESVMESTMFDSASLRQAFGKLQNDAILPSGSVPGFKDFAGAFADWQAGKDEWMLPVLKNWFENNMTSDVPLAAGAANMYEGVLAMAKADLTVNKESVADVLAMIAYQIKSANLGIDADELMKGLVNYGIVTDIQKAANVVAEWMADAIPIKPFNAAGTPVGPPSKEWLKTYNPNFNITHDTGIANAWNKYKTDPNALDSIWKDAFQQWEAVGVETPAPAMVSLPGVEKEAFKSEITPEKLGDLLVQWHVDFPAASDLSHAEFTQMVAQYQAGYSTENVTAWFEKNAPELKVEGKELGASTASATSFTAQTTLLAWSPTNDKWAKQFGKAHPKLYTSFSKVFKSKAFIHEITKDLVFPVYAQKNPVKLARLRLKVALARTYNMAVKGKMAELAALDPNLVAFWKAKLGDLAPAMKPVLAIKTDLATLQRVRDELKTSNTAWYPDFRGQFGHSITMKIVPELANVTIDIPASSTRERELRALAYAKSYMMARAGDVAGLKAIDERLLYFWDEKLGGGLAPKIAVTLEGAPWIHELNALYTGSWDQYNGSGIAKRDAIDAKYARSSRAKEWANLKGGISSFTGSNNVAVREAGAAILKGGAGGSFGIKAKAMLEAIQDAPATAPALSRKESWASVAQRAGTTRDGLAAFLQAKIGTDYAFTMDMVSTQYKGHWGGDLEWRIEKGAKAIYAQPYSGSPGENEFITAGRFKILKIDHTSTKLVVYVRQVGVFDAPD